MERDKIQEEYKNTFCTNNNYGFFDLNIMYRYPIVIYNGEYLIPSPHFLAVGCSESLRYRLTDNNDKLNTDMGTAFEKYALHLLKDCEAYKDCTIIPEFNYTRENKAFADITLVLKDSTVIIIEAKNFSPNLKIRELNKENIEKTEKRLVEHILQTYRKISDAKKGLIMRDDFPSNPKEIFGIVLIANDYYGGYSKIFDMAYDEIIKTMDSNLNKDDFCKSIVVLSINGFESTLDMNKDGLLAIFEYRIKDNRQLFNLGYENINNYDGYKGLPSRWKFKDDTDKQILAIAKKIQDDAKRGR